MDIGCGLGDWVVWLKGVKKCDVAAVNLTEAQARVVRERGVDCTGSAWQLLAADETPDAKAFTMLTQLESSAALRDLMETHLLSSSAAAAADGELSVRLFTYTAPKYAKNSAYKA